jgi:hypothetical protein
VRLGSHDHHCGRVAPGRCRLDSTGSTQQAYSAPSHVMVDAQLFTVHALHRKIPVNVS